MADIVRSKQKSRVTTGTDKVRNIVELSRSQAARIADVIEPLVHKYGSRKALADALGINEGALRNVAKRSACTRVNKKYFDTMIKAIGMDVSTWDLTKVV